jgi:hypothetical protein
MLRLMAFAMAAVLVACGGSSSTAPTVLNIAGTWNFSDAISNNALAASCQSTSTASVSQTGSSFSANVSNGTQVCTQNGSVFSNLSGLSAVISGGQINGTGLSFVDDGGCNYTGTISGSPPNRISGSESCTISSSGAQYVFLGTWQAAR